ncbi:AAA family ATPase, partial [bacterium]|nr:AAA family ATPase [bacterium]
MTNRILPAQDIVSEQACLGACLIDGSVFDEVSGIITSSEDFYDPAHQEIYKAMASLVGENKAIDILTLSDYLRKHGKLDNCRGVIYLNTLADQGIVANAGSYAKIVVENAILRRLQQASYAINNIAQNEELNINEKIDRSEEIVLSVGLNKGRGDLEPISKVIGDVFVRSYNKIFGGAIVSGLPSGFKELDEITSGFHPSNLIILGARPSMGKTAFALAVAVNVALNESHPGKVAIFSLEMSREDLCTRMVCSLAKINNQNLLRGETAEEKNA